MNDKSSPAVLTAKPLTTVREMCQNEPDKLELNLPTSRDVIPREKYRHPNKINVHATIVPLMLYEKKNLSENYSGKRMSQHDRLLFFSFFPKKGKGFHFFFFVIH